MLDNVVLKNEERAMFSLRSLYKSYGYSPFKMSKFEEYDLYAKNKDFLVSDRVITFNDTDGRLLALKPDVTLSIIKNTTGKSYDKHKVYYNENVYRVSGTTGQFKEIVQMGLECIGDIDISDIYEVVSLAAQSLASVSEDYVLDISHMGIVTALLDEIQPGYDFKSKITSLIAEKNSHEILAVCNEMGVSEDYAHKLASLALMHGNREEVINRLEAICISSEAQKALRELKILDGLFTESGFGNKVRFDFSVVNNMNYYNGIVFKGFLSGIFEGVLAGGEYDNLLRSMGQNRRAIGFALYLDLLEELDSLTNEYDVDVMLIYDKDTDPAKILNAKNEMIKQGRSVYTATIVPEKITYKEIVKVN